MGPFPWMVRKPIRSFPRSADPVVFTGFSPNDIWWERQIWNWFTREPWVSQVSEPAALLLKLPWLRSRFGNGIFGRGGNPARAKRYNVNPDLPTRKPGHSFAA